MKETLESLAAFLAKLLDRPRSSIKFQVVNSRGNLEVKLEFNALTDEEREKLAVAKSKLISIVKDPTRPDFRFLKMLAHRLDYRANQAELALSVFEKQDGILRTSIKGAPVGNVETWIFTNACLVNMFNESSEWPDEIRSQWEQEHFVQTKHLHNKYKIAFAMNRTPNDWKVLDWYFSREAAPAAILPPIPFTKRKEPLPYLRIVARDRIAERWFQNFGGVDVHEAIRMKLDTPLDENEHSIFWFDVMAKRLALLLPSCLHNLPQESRRPFFS